MGLIKAAVSAIGSGLADQWLEFLEADEMGEGTVFTGAKAVRPGKGSNTKGSADYVSNGSRIVVQKNQFMMLVDGGKIVDHTAEEGYYTVNNSSAPSLFNGQFGESLGDAFNRIKFGGVPSGKQQVFFINLQEIKGNRFGTPTPMNYFDTFYNAELFLRAHGHYSIRITNPLQFYAEVIPRDATHLQFSDVAEQYLAEFLQAFQISVNKLSAEGERISFIQSKIKDRLNAEVDAELDEKWGPRGFELVEIGVDGLSYDDQSQELINMRNQGAMLSDATIREGFVQGQIAQGIRSAGENPNGGAVGMMGVGMGMNAGMGFMGQASNTNYQQMQMQQQAQQQAQAQAQAAAQAQQMQAASQVAAGSWKCPTCGADNTGKFCTECGAKRPESSAWKCPNCGAENSGKFCTECGNPRP